jgi:hypothetical protein
MGPGWLGIVAGAVALGALVVAVVVARRRDRAAASAKAGAGAGLGSDSGSGSGSGSGLVRAVMIGALIYAGITVVSTILVVATFIVGRTGDVVLPLRVQPIVVPDGVEFLTGPTAQLTGGGISAAAVTVGDLSLGASLVLGLGHLAQGATFAFVAVTIALLARNLLAGRPFQSIVGRAIGLSGTAIGVGGILWQVLIGIGSHRAAEEALFVSAWSGEGASTADLASRGWPEASLSLEIEFWPIMMGLALTALAAVFRAGDRMSRRTVELEKETEGLV